MSDVYLVDPEAVNEIFAVKDKLWILGRLIMTRQNLRQNPFSPNPDPKKLKVICRIRTGLWTVDSRQVINPNQIVYKSISQHRKGIYVFVMEKICELLTDNIVMTKRDLFYQNVQLFKNKQYVCDQVIDDIAVSLGVERSQLNLVASSKGLVVGPITFTLTSGALVDCSNHVCLIPSESNIASIQVNATHLLVIEKDATFEALLQHNFLQTHPHVILVTGKGFPDIATRSLVRALSSQYVPQNRIPGLLVDSIIGDADFWDDSDVVSNDQVVVDSHQIDQFMDDVLFWSEDVKDVPQMNHHPFSLDDDFMDDDDFDSVPNLELTRHSLSQSNNVVPFIPPPRLNHLAPSISSQVDDNPLHSASPNSPNQVDTPAAPPLPDQGFQLTPQILVDCDPDGFEIYLCYKTGSKAMAFSALQLACPPLEWIGLKPTHISIYNNDTLGHEEEGSIVVVDQTQLIPLSVRDRFKLVGMLSRDQVGRNRQLRREMMVLLMRGYKSELQALSIPELIRHTVDRYSLP